MQEAVEAYYSEVLTTSGDLKTNACSTAGAPPPHLANLLANIHPEVSATYYGCGLVYPHELNGARVLDLGCGSGRDCYVLAQLVGESGAVVGVDMTDKQLDTARRHAEYHAQKFGYAKSNVRFLKGYLETLDELDLEPGSFDAIVSNCVINLATDKPAVLRHAWSLLKPGGELYFADVYADRRLPASVASDPELYGECLGGALYWNDFLDVARDAGFRDPRLVADNPIAVTDAAVAARLGGAKFYAATYRLFKLDALEPACEDYGQAVVYRGSLPDAPDAFTLDKYHVMQTGRAFPVCGNTWRMLHDTRLRPHFDFVGDFNRHYGIFEGCGMQIPFDADTGAGTAESGCC